MPELAFTTRIPLAVMMIAMGIKRWENRAAMPITAKGRCAMTCSKSSDAREYANFLAWAERVFKPEAFAALPAWERVEGWRGKLVAVCDYEASYAAPNPPVWNEGYPVWWLVAFDQCAVAGRADSRSRQCGDVAVAEGGG